MGIESRSSVTVPSELSRLIVCCKVSFISHHVKLARPRLQEMQYFKPDYKCAVHMRRIFHIMGYIRSELLLRCIVRNVLWVACAQTKPKVRGEIRNGFCFRVTKLVSSGCIQTSWGESREVGGLARWEESLTTASRWLAAQKGQRPPAKYDLRTSLAR
jgi:hypothetical protein